MHIHNFLGGGVAERKMSDCIYKSDGQEIVNIYLCSVCPMLSIISMRSLRFMIVLVTACVLCGVKCEPSARIAA